MMYIDICHRFHFVIGGWNGITQGTKLFPPIPVFLLLIFIILHGLLVLATCSRYLSFSASRVI